jgi:glycosyltransferase involved in cell wall biosynthesis
MHPSVSITICTHNRAMLLARTLESLGKLQIPGQIALDLLVVTNACTDETESVINSAAQWMPFPMRSVNERILGVSHARNRALRESRGEILASFDDDVWVDEHWLLETLRTYREFPADMVGGHVALWWETAAQPAWFNSGFAWLLSECDCGEKTFQMRDGTGAIGGNLSFRRGVIETIGNFRLDLGRVGRKTMAGEETDFICRALAAGLRVFHSPTVRVKHWVPAARATPGYLACAMHGFARGSVMMKPQFGFALASRSIVGNLFLLARHALGRALARLRGDEAAEVLHRIHMAGSRGALAGAIQRIFSSRAWKSDVASPREIIGSAGTSPARGN